MSESNTSLEKFAIFWFSPWVELTISLDVMDKFGWNYANIFIIMPSHCVQNLGFSCWSRMEKMNLKVCVCSKPTAKTITSAKFSKKLCGLKNKKTSRPEIIGKVTKHNL